MFSLLSLANMVMAKVECMVSTTPQTENTVRGKKHAPIVYEKVDALETISTALKDSLARIKARQETVTVRVQAMLHAMDSTGKNSKQGQPLDVAADISPLPLLDCLTDQRKCTHAVLNLFIGVAKKDATFIEVPELVRLMETGILCIDVRAPIEYSRGHVPGAVSIPLLDDNERANVGTVFKHEGRMAAMRVGMKNIRKKHKQLLATVATLVEKRREANGDGMECKGIDIVVYCARGGMRSCSVSWVLRHKLNMRVRTLSRGYKGFRFWAENLFVLRPKQEAFFQELNDSEREEKWKQMFKQGPPVIIIGGRTGCGKTRLLLSLRDDYNQQIVDLEGLAAHKGSSFGWVGEQDQPTNQQFGNDVAVEWSRLDPRRAVFVEDEGPNVGKVTTPFGIYQLMRYAPIVIKIVVSLQARISVLLEDYATEEAKTAHVDWEDRMLHSIDRLSKRVAPQRVAKLKQLFKDRDSEGFALEMLNYYDHLYDKHLAGSEEESRNGKIVEVDAGQHRIVFDAKHLSHKVLQTLKDQGHFSSLGVETPSL
eukprot:m.31077 g.31077  ORF g.31077 m.31077 type:complete len:539 (+) comp8276_c0_seq2:162-1778(+)